ncbi:MAG: O-antigen ligase family protein [Pseudomonadota bacterium]
MTEIAGYRVVQASVFWLVAIAVLHSSLWLGANRPFAWISLSILVLLALSVQAVLDTRDRSARRLWSRCVLLAFPYSLVIFWALLQTAPIPFSELAHPAWSSLPDLGAISPDPSAGLQGALRLSLYGALFWIGARAASDPTRMRLFVDVIAIFSIALAVYGLAAVWIGANPITGPSAYPGSVTASFVNRNAYAMYSGIGAMACLTSLALRLPGDRVLTFRGFLDLAFARGPVFSAGFCVLLTAVAMTGSRAGAASVLVGLLVLACTVVTPKRRGSITAVLCVLALPLIFAAWNADELWNRLADANLLENKRLALYAVIIQAIAERPWTGYGLGAFQDAFRSHMPAGFSAADWDLAHSSYLENAFELGLPAATTFYALLFAVCWRLGLGLRRRRSQRPLVAFGLAITVSAGLHGGLDFSLQMPATAALFALILGASWALSRKSTARNIVAAPVLPPVGYRSQFE